MSLLQPTSAGQFVTRTDWNGYLTYLRLLSEQRVKITYDRGKLELLSPSRLHEKTKKIIGALIECLLEELGINAQGGGQTTFRHEALDSGLEPDECYWIRSLPRSLLPADSPDSEPVPDLAVEVEVSRSSLNRLGIYAALGVNEVWRWIADGEGHLTVLGLTAKNSYETLQASPTFPDVSIKVFEEYVRLGLSIGMIDAVRQFRTWIRTTLLKTD